MLNNPPDWHIDERVERAEDEAPCTCGNCNDCVDDYLAYIDAQIDAQREREAFGD